MNASLFNRNVIKILVISVSILFVVLLALAAFWTWVYPSKNFAQILGSTVVNFDALVATSTPDRQKTTEERIAEAQERSSNVRGVYLAGGVAVDQGRGSTKIRDKVKELIRTTELNGVVIDVKEVDGLFLGENMKKTVKDFHDQGVWVIARLVVFRDLGGIKAHSVSYLKLKDGTIWKDNRGGAWLDPADPRAWAYIADVAKRSIDQGFDEIQFDYIRFPSDGDLSKAAYPVYDYKTPRYVYMKKFFTYLNKELKAHKPDIIISADLFGYVATASSDLSIGQRLADIGDSFDYISFMVYPSHYYAGFEMSADPARALPYIKYPYKSSNIKEVVSNHPYEVVYRSLLRARDFLDGKISNGTKNLKVSQSTTTAAVSTSTNILLTGSNVASTTPSLRISRARFRPWLQDFNLGADTKRGIFYDAEKVRAQIKAAEDSGSSGWLLWNASNIYTESALRKESESSALLKAKL